MEMQTVLQPSAYEQVLISIIRTLPVERVIQVLDYARYIQSQVIEDFNLLEIDETEEEILADEARWDAQFAATQDGLKKMADKVRAEIGAGRTMPGEEMAKQAEIQLALYEQMLINIVRTLPPERVAELIDFARFLESLVVKPSEPAVLEEEEGKGDKKWEQLLAKPEAQQAMLDMAREARADLYAGRTTEITVTEDGRLAPA